MLKRIKKIIVRILACFIRDKEKRRIFRNTLTTDTIPYPGYSYIMKPFHGNRNSLTIGKYVSIARDVTIGPGNHPLEKFTTSPYIYSHLSKEDLDNKYARPVCIDNDVWIGTKAVILNGVHIHTGAVVGAGAVVTKDVPPYAIVAGVPAKIIKYRFDNNTINALLKSHWWDLPMDIIKKAPLNDINKAIEYFQNYRNSL